MSGPSIAGHRHGPDGQRRSAGDPAVDVQVAWSPLFAGETRRISFDALDVDDATIARRRPMSRQLVTFKALATLS